MTLLTAVLTGVVWAQEEVPPTLTAEEDSLSLPVVTLQPTSIGMGLVALPEFNLRQPLSSRT